MASLKPTFGNTYLLIFKNHFYFLKTILILCLSLCLVITALSWCCWMEGVFGWKSLIFSLIIFLYCFPCVLQHCLLRLSACRAGCLWQRWCHIISHCLCSPAVQPGQSCTRRWSLFLHQLKSRHLLYYFDKEIWWKWFCAYFLSIALSCPGSFICLLHGSQQSCKICVYPDAPG